MEIFALSYRCSIIQLLKFDGYHSNEFSNSLDEAIQRESKICQNNKDQMVFGGQGPVSQKPRKVFGS